MMKERRTNGVDVCGRGDARVKKVDVFPEVSKRNGVLLAAGGGLCRWGFGELGAIEEYRQRSNIWDDGEIGFLPNL